MSKHSGEKKTLSIVIPVYYNEGSLPLLFKKLTEIEGHLKKINIDLQLIFVDDGSGDNSLALLKGFKQQQVSKSPNSITIIKLARNFGSVNASKTGFQYVKGDCFMILAADLQDNPDLICQMIEKWLAGAKYVICVREERDDPLTSRIFASLYYKVIRCFVISDYPATGFDVALMDKALLPYIQKSGKHINVPFFPYWLGYKPEVLHYKRVARSHGKSRWTFGKKIKFFIDGVFGFSTTPIRFISATGFFVSLVSFLYGIVVIISAITGDLKVPGFATIISLLSFFFGLIIFILGIICEYVWRIFDEVSQTPATVIDEVL